MIIFEVLVGWCMVPMYEDAVDDEIVPSFYLLASLRGKDSKSSNALWTFSTNVFVLHEKALSLAICDNYKVLKLTSLQPPNSSSNFSAEQQSHN